MITWVFLIFAILCNTAESILVKLTSLKHFETKLEVYFTLEFILAITFFGLNLMLMTQALKKIPLSVAYPILVGATLVGITIFAVFYFNEKLTLTDYCGITLITFGIALLSK